MKLPEHIIVTGANGQTSITIAKALLEQGCNLVLLCHKRTDRAEALVQAFPKQCQLHKVNLADSSQVAVLFTELGKDNSFQPGGLVHAAALRSYDAKPLAESEAGIWQAVFYQNVNMAYNILRNVLPGMVQRLSGKIVLFGSNVTRTGLPYGSAYSAAKAALANLARSIAWETASQNIQINLVSPAPIETKLEEDYSGEYLKFRQEYFNAYKKSHPAHKLVTTEEVSRVVLSLLDLEITMQSGEEIYLTGGVL
jgi:3-hydroxybutyrate dehydrogenase